MTSSGESVTLAQTVLECAVRHRALQVTRSSLATLFHR